MKLVKTNVWFKCPIDECPGVEKSNAVDCFRCFLQHIWVNNLYSGKNKLEGAGLLDLREKEEVKKDKVISLKEIKLLDKYDILNLPEQLTTEDIEFLKEENLHLLISAREWKIEDEEKEKEKD